jgi:hypothetical protein
MPIFNFVRNSVAQQHFVKSMQGQKNTIFSGIHTSLTYAHIRSYITFRDSNPNCIPTHSTSSTQTSHNSSMPHASPHLATPHPAHSRRTLISEQLIILSSSHSTLKGQCHEIFDFWFFFHEYSFPQAPEYIITAISNFFENVSLTPMANGKNLQSEKF